MLLVINSAPGFVGWSRCFCHRSFVSDLDSNHCFLPALGLLDPWNLAAHSLPGQITTFGRYRIGPTTTPACLAKKELFFTVVKIHDSNMCSILGLCQAKAQLARPSESYGANQGYQTSEQSSPSSVWFFPWLPSVARR